MVRTRVHSLKRTTLANSGRKSLSTNSQGHLLVSEVGVDVSGLTSNPPW